MTKKTGVRRENKRFRKDATLRKTRLNAVALTLLTIATACAALFGAVRTTCADESKGDKNWRPIAVVGSVGYDALWEAAERLAAEMKLVEAVEAARAIYGDAQGVDREKPFGFVVATDGSEIVPFAFLPVASVEKLEFVGVSDLKEEIETTSEGMFIGDSPRWRLLEKDGWLFVFEEGKEDVVPTSDPTAWLGDGGASALTFQLDLTAFPEELLEAGFAAARQKIAENAPTSDAELEQFEAALEQFDATLEYYSAIFDSLERFACALNVDAATGDLVWECSLVCKDGSPLAETLAGTQNAETRWSAIAETPDAVFAVVEAGKYSALDREYLAGQQANAFENFKNALEIGLDSDEEQALAKELLAVFEKLANSASDDGTFDSASALVCGSSVWTAFAVAPIDGSELPDAARKIFDKLKKDEPEFADKIDEFVKIDTKIVEGFSVSTLDVPFAEFDADIPEAFAAYWGDKTLAVRFGTSADAILVVAGIDATVVDAEFARVAAASKTKTPAPKRSAFAVAPLGRWALEAFDESGALTAVARKTMQRIAEADDARFEVEYAIDGNRLDARYVVKAGVFRLIGDLVRTGLTAGSGDEGEDVDSLFEEE